MFQVEGHVSDIITDMPLDWLENQRAKEEPFFLCVHHEAPHRTWIPAAKYKTLYEDEDRAQPDEATFNDTCGGRPAAEAAQMRMLGHLNEKDVKGTPAEGLSESDLKNWYYQRHIKDYLRCVASVDESVGRILGASQPVRRPGLRGPGPRVAAGAARAAAQVPRRAERA